MIQKMIMEALTGTIDKEVALCRVACNAAASSKMFCGCGDCLDQERTVVATVKTPKRRAVIAYCLDCWEFMKKDVLQAAEDTQTPILVEGWDGVIFEQGDVK